MSLFSCLYFAIMVISSFVLISNEFHQIRNPQEGHTLKNTFGIPLASSNVLGQICTLADFQWPSASLYSAEYLTLLKVGLIPYSVFLSQCKAHLHKIIICIKTVILGKRNYVSELILRSQQAPYLLFTSKQQDQLLLIIKKHFAIIAKYLQNYLQ